MPASKPPKRFLCSPGVYAWVRDLERTQSLLKEAVEYLLTSHPSRKRLGYANYPFFFFSAAAFFASDLLQRSSVGWMGLNNFARNLCCFSFHALSCFSV